MYQGKMVQTARMALMVRMVDKGHKGCKVFKAYKAHRAFKVLTARLGSGTGPSPGRRPDTW